MSTVLPPASGPAYVRTEVTAGIVAGVPFSSTNVNQLFGLTALVSPSFRVTLTCARPAPSLGSFAGTASEPGGIWAEIVVGPVTLNAALGSSTAPTWTLLTSGVPFCSKFVPVIVTDVAEAVEPTAGVTLVIVGRV